MGTRSLYGSLLAPIPVLLGILTLAVHWGTAATSCLGIDSCWNTYQLAEVNLGVTDDAIESLSPGQVRLKCIVLRTLAQCIRNMSGGCSGDILYRGAEKGAEKQMALLNCSAVGPIYKHVPQTVGPNNKVCSYRGPKKHRHCGLFGDPHLRTFYDEYQTCKVQGAWPLIDNEHITVQVTNDPVVWDGSATAASKLTVMIKKDECASNHFVTYQAQTDYLPGMFDDGSQHIGPHKSVSIKEVKPNRHVELYLRYIDTTLVLRQVGRYFSVAIKMPEEIVNYSRNNSPDGIQLCIKGCPRNERINYKEFLAQKHGRLKNHVDSNQVKIAMTRNGAVALCKKAKVVDFYFDSCVFDLMVTGDTNFTLAANQAQNDVLRLHPQVRKMHKNRTELDFGYSSRSSANRSSSLRTTKNSLHRILYVLLGLLCTLLSNKQWLHFVV